MILWTLTDILGEVVSYFLTPIKNHMREGTENYRRDNEMKKWWDGEFKWINYVSQRYEKDLTSRPYIFLNLFYLCVLVWPKSLWNRLMFVFYQIEVSDRSWLDISQRVTLRTFWSNEGSVLIIFSGCVVLR